MPESFLTATVMPATKWLGAKATCCWRATELVVVAQSRSTVPFCIRGMRLSEVRVVYSTRSAGKPSLAFTASTILRQMSFENPIGSLPPLATYENGMELSRLPMRMTPLSLILRSVSMSWADTTWDTRATPSSRASGNWARRFMVRRLHSREQAGVIDSAPTRSTARASSAGGGCENSGATLNSKKAIFCCDLTFHKAIERRTMMTFKQLEALYWIVQLGGFAPAAQKLHTSQSAVSKRVHELEQAFDTPLFDRSQRTARLTEKGEEMFLLARKLLRERDLAVEQFAKPEVIERRLRIGVTELTAMTWLPRLVALVQEHYPKVKLEPDVDGSLPLRDKLLADELDLILVPDAFADTRLRSKVVGQVESAWMAKPGLVPSGTTRLHELAQVPLLSLGMLAVIDVEPALPAVPYVALYKGEVRSTLTSALIMLAQSCCDFSRAFQTAPA